MMTEVFNLPLLPIYLVDYLGSVLMVTLFFRALYFARRLSRLEPKNLLWSYFFWFSLVMVVFFLSLAGWGISSPIC